MSNEYNKMFMSDWIKTQFKVEEQIESDRRKAIRKQQLQAREKWNKTTESSVIFNPEEKINDNK
jgi:DNA-binding helix-hairpin-helix protein with protein kinase domain